MTILAFLVITFGMGTAGLLTRRRPPVSKAVGFVGLVAAVISALLISSGDRLVVGTSALVATDFMRLFILFCSVAALALCAMALVEGWQRNLPSAMLLALGALALGLGLADPVAGLAATAAAGLPGVLVAITTPVNARGVQAAERELRAVAVTGALAIVAAALVSGPSGLLNLPVTIVGIAYLAMAFAVAVRIGAIPFHSRVARVTGSAPVAALPLLLAWAPAGFASAALVWVDGNIATTAIPLESQRIVIVAVGLLCILLGIVAATIQDDIEHVVGYSVIQDAGFVMLALAIFDIAAWEPARAWLLIYIVTKSAFAGWALAMRTSFGTSRIGELSGWVRRAPILAITLLAIVAATVGIPGILVFDVRSHLADLALGSPLGLLAVVGGFASLLYYGRLVKVGIGPVAPLVAAYPGIAPRGPGWVRAHAMADAGDPAAGPEPGGDIAEASAAPGGAADAVMGATGAGRRWRRTAAPDQPAMDDLAAAVPEPAGAEAALDPAEEAAAPDQGAAMPEAPVADAVPAAATAPATAPARPGPAVAASAGTPSSRGPSTDALRRDPKELTQAWAREALERAGLVPGGATAPTPGTGAMDASSRTLPRSTGVHVIPPVEDVGAPQDPWSAEAAAESERRSAAAEPGAGPAWPEGGAEADRSGPVVRRERRPRERRRAAAADGGTTGGGPVRPRDLWAANRLLVVALLALGLSAMGVAAAVGAFGVADAAKAAAPASGGGVEYGPIQDGGEPTGPGAVTGPAGGSPAPVATEPGSSSGTDASAGTDGATSARSAAPSSEAPSDQAPDATSGAEATPAP